MGKDTPMDPVVHFEMPADDRDRMATFYQTVFNWQTTKLGKEMMDYVLVKTTKTTDDGTPSRVGAINGGFYPKKPDWPAQYPSVTISVSDIQMSMHKVRNAGGEVLGEPMEIPGFGQYVSFIDTEGNRVSMIQPTDDWNEKTNKK